MDARNKRFRLLLDANPVPRVTVTNLWGYTDTLIEANTDKDTFDSNSGGTIVNVGGGGVNGETVISKTAVANGGNPLSRKTGMTPLTLDGMFSYMAKISDLSKFSATVTYLYRETARSGGDYLAFDRWGVGTGVTKNANGYWSAASIEEDVWYQLQWPGESFSAGGGAPAFASNTLDFDGVDLRVDSDDTVGAGLEVQVGEFRGNCRHNIATICFTFDDSHNTDATIAQPMLTAEGWAGTTYTIPRLIDSGGLYSSSAQLAALQAAGWDVASHGVETAGFANLSLMSYEEQVAELTKVRAALQGYSGWQHFSYPEGKRNELTMRVLRELGFKTARTTNTAQEAPFVLGLNYPLLLLRGYGTSNATTGTGTYDASILTGVVDDAIAKGAVVIFYTHRIQSPTLANGHTAEACMQALVDYVKIKETAGDVQVKTVSQLYDEATA